MKKLQFMVVSFVCLVVFGFLDSAMAYSRPMPTKQIQTGISVLGGQKPVVCIPMVGQTREDILKEAKNVPNIAPDMVELRTDFWNFIEDTNKSVSMVREVRKIIGDVPILLTCRIKSERGHKEVSDRAKFALYNKVTKEKLVNLIDMELAYGPEVIQKFKKSLSGSGIGLVVAFHYMKNTPGKEEIVQTMEKEVEAGADVAKIVVLPQSEEDVLTFLGGILAFRRAHPEYPIIASGSGPIGAVTRLIGGLFGIDLTFAVGSKASGPGQMPVDVVRQCLEVVYPK